MTVRPAVCCVLPAMLPALLLLLASPSFHSYPFGAPACVSRPRHGAAPQPGPAPLEVTRQQGPAGAVRLTLRAGAGLAGGFRGFLVVTAAPGTFLPANMTAGMECSGLLGSRGPPHIAVTHTDSSDKQEVELVFQQEEGAQLEPHFDIVVLKNFTTYWTDIKA